VTAVQDAIETEECRCHTVTWQACPCLNGKTVASRKISDSLFVNVCMPLKDVRTCVRALCHVRKKSGRRKFAPPHRHAFSY
jgi:hypothetical protein